MSDFEKHVRQIEEWNEWIAGVLGRFLLSWAYIERDLRTLWFMRVGDNEFQLQDKPTLQERLKHSRPSSFHKLVKCTVPDGEVKINRLFPEHLDFRLKGSVPGGNLRRWLSQNWETRNLVVHGPVGFRVESLEEVVAYIADGDFLAITQAGQAGEKADCSGKGIDVRELVPLTEEAEQVQRCLMRVHMMGASEWIRLLPSPGSGLPPGARAPMQMNR